MKFRLVQVVSTAIAKLHHNAMQVHAVFLCLILNCVLGAPPQPMSWANTFVSNYRYPVNIGLPQQHLQFDAYQDAYSPYYMYNLVQVDPNASPAAVLPNGRPGIPHIPNYNYYYGSPVYDFRFPLTPVYPVLRPVRPVYSTPTTPPTSTTEPLDDDDGIEKLDSKVDPETEMKKPLAPSFDDDSVTIEAI